MKAVKKETKEERLAREAEESIELKASERVQNIVGMIREKYSVDDEIAMIYKDDTDEEKVAYREYVQLCKDTFNQ